MSADRHFAFIEKRFPKDLLKLELPEGFRKVQRLGV